MAFYSLQLKKRGWCWGGTTLVAYFFLISGHLSFCLWSSLRDQSFHSVSPRWKEIVIIIPDIQAIISSSYWTPRAYSFSTGSFILTVCHLSNSRALGPSVLKIWHVIKIQCFDVFWQKYWISDQYEKNYNLYHILRVYV